MSLPSFGEEGEYGRGGKNPPSYTMAKWAKKKGIQSLIFTEEQAPKRRRGGVFISPLQRGGGGGGWGKFELFTHYRGIRGVGNYLLRFPRR